MLEEYDSTEDKDDDENEQETPASYFRFAL